MNYFKRFLAKRLYLLLFLFCYMVFSFATYKNFGTTIDEPNAYSRGKLFYMKVRNNDPEQQINFVIPKTGNQLPIYNSVYTGFAYALNDNEDLEIYHLINLIFGSLIFIAMYELVLHYSNSSIMSLVGTVFLFFTPRFLGHIPANPKDVPFAISYFLAITAVILTSKTEEKLRIVLLGILFGFTQSLRVVGYSMYIVYFFYLVMRFRKNLFNLRKVVNLTLEMILIFMIGFLVHIITMPYLGADPFNNFISLLNISQQFEWVGPVKIWGVSHVSTALPWFYLPSWILITTPLFIIVAACYGLVFGDKKKLVYRIVVTALVINLTIFFTIKPVVYDGLRHMVFLLPMLVILCSIGVWEFYKKKYNRIIVYSVSGLLLFNMLSVLIAYRQLHPHQYIYFNELVGGLPGAYGKFDTDYWGSTNKEALLWLHNYLNKQKINNVVVHICGNYSLKIDTPRNSPEISFTHSPQKADYVICWERNDEHKEIKGEIIHTITRQNIPLSHIYKTKQY